MRGKSLAYKPGAGAGRDYWAIKKWLDRKGLTIADIAAAAEFSVGIVSQTIRGIRNSRRVLIVFINLGCPAKHLSLPEDMKKKTAQQNVALN